MNPLARFLTNNRSDDLIYSDLSTDTIEMDLFDPSVNSSQIALTETSSDWLITESVMAAVSISPSEQLPSGLMMDWSLIIEAVVLSVIVLLTIGGNLLILAAVLFNSNLRGPTHILIANLAVADLLLGFLVLPFSATLEVTGNWYFGPIFCDVWAAVDVLCCTASIMSLCVISVDRYIGVTRPLNYYSIVTAKRSTVLCLIVWISSLSISIGPLLGWKERTSSDDSAITNSNGSLLFDTDPTVLPTLAEVMTDSYDQQACNVNKEKGYVLFSAIGSFYLPTLIILAVYWRIYRAAVKQTKFLESGTKTDKSTSSLSSEVLTLRVHVGRSMPMKPVATVANHLHVVKGRPTSSARSSFDSTNNSDRSSAKNCRTPRPSLAIQHPSPMLDSELVKDLDEATGAMMKRSLGNNVHHGQRRGSKRPSSAGPTINSLEVPSTSSAVTGSASSSSTGLSAKMFKFRRQKKAAKTLGIVVGAFLLCWFPFFVILPVEALCSTCGIPSPLFSCCFWLGYCNSCLNPFIYASTSREFKRAFSKILCGRRGTSNGANRNYMQHHHLMPLSHQARTPSVSNVSPTLARRESPTQARLSDEDQST